MDLRTLVTRISTIWSDEDRGADGDLATTSAEETTPAEEQTLSYADQIEYGVDERELADEDHVLRLLVKRGGRVDEQTIVEETGWSESRLERVVEEMEDDGQISAITVGRKRVICRRGFEPKGYRSHLNE